MSNVVAPPRPYSRRQNVFVINDVDLIVPPSNIHVQKEDLVWSWRALRSKASTKIPSGSGQIAIQVSIPFTESMILDMHRLIVEFRHSPFCYIENRFLRETIVPHWPGSQSMAFTMTGLSVAPMQGSSDTWVMQLDLTWFNYAPYLHNWLYRKEWATLPLNGEGPTQNSDSYELTIGWGWKDGVKIPRQIVLPRLGEFTDNEVREWNVVQNQFVDRKILTIDDMALLHRGEVFDLLPLPNSMSIANFVARPAHSRIYTRYINYLQRDALLDNFGIDIELDMGWRKDKATPLHNSFFSAIRRDNERYTYGLHSGPPVNSSLSSEYKSLVSDSATGWISRMNATQGRVTFSFASYQEVRLPEGWSKKLSAAHQNSIQNAKANLGASSLVAESPSFVNVYEAGDSSPVTSRVRVRRKLSTSLGHDGELRVVPIGESVDKGPMTVSMALKRIVSWPKWRSASKRNELYNGKGKKNKINTGAMHWGIDFGASVGSPVYAIESGIISSIKLVDNSRNGSWVLITPDKSSKGYSQAGISNAEDFKASLLAIEPGIEFKGFNVKSTIDGGKFPTGTFVKSLTYAGWYMAISNNAGNRIRIAHGANLSMYFHLDSIAPGIKHGDEVSAGTLIGFVGKTGALSGDTIRNNVEYAQSAYAPGNISTNRWFSDLNGIVLSPGAERSSVWHLPAHLHFEYWETLDEGIQYDDPYNFKDGVKEATRRYSGRVPVDLRGSLELALKNNSEIKYNLALSNPSRASVEAAINEDPEASQKEVRTMLDLLSDLWDDKWLYYDRDSSITNVWWKVFHLNVQPGNFEKYDSRERDTVFSDDNLILTAVAGGLRHVVANIPILGHEFPTQQHLGSIEPFYSFEFVSLDDQGSSNQRLAGISRSAQALVGMRTMLHSNARNFRAITDCWTTTCNSFITRLLGSYKELDVRILYNEKNSEDVSGVEPVIADIDLKRRLIATRGSSMNVQGQPGLTSHTLEFMETNPYEGESISSTAPKKEEREKSRRELLTRLYKFDFAEKYKDVIQAIFIAQLAGAQLSQPSWDKYGQFDLEYISRPVSVGSGKVSLYKQGDVDWIIAGDDNSPLAVGLDGLSGAKLRSIPGYPDLKGIPLSEVIDEKYIRGGGFKTTTTKGSSVLSKGGSSSGYSTVEIHRISDLSFDISGMLTDSQDTLLAAEIPITRLLDYWMLIHKTIKTAELMMAEGPEQLNFGNLNAGGMTISQISNELYGLPIVPSLFKSFQYYLQQIAEINPKYAPDRTGGISSSLSDALSFSETALLIANANYAGLGEKALEASSKLFYNPSSSGIPEAGKATEYLEKSKNWLIWNKEYKLSTSDKSNLQLSFASGAGAFGEAVLGSGLRSLDFMLAATLGFVDRDLRTSALMKLAGTYDENQKGMFAEFWGANLKSIYNDIAKNYIFKLPLADLLEDRFKAYVSASVFGDILGNITDGKGSPVFASTLEQLEDTVASCGNFGFSPVGDMVMFTIDRNPPSVIGSELPNDQGSSFDLSSPGASNEAVQIPVLELDSSTWSWTWFNGLEGIYAPNSPWSWKINIGLEQKKLRYFKQLLALYADKMIGDVGVLRAFGLESLSHANIRASIKGSPALPDMDLPYHPYYGDLASCPPDFYMWNMYEDGRAYSADVKAAMTASMESVVESAYNSMKGMEKGSEYDPEDDQIVLEPPVSQDINSSERLRLDTRLNAEGTDGGFGGDSDKGHTAFPFYPNPNSTISIATHLGSVNDAAQRAVDKANASRKLGTENKGKKLVLSKRDAINLDTKKVNNVTLSNFEGPFGQGGGVNYPRRVPEDQYKDLATTVKGLTQMFGHRSGYLDAKDFPDEVNNRWKGTVIERSTNPTHSFDLSSIQSLARESTKDILSQKRMLRRAYPTFKLFFVEEDEFESRLLNFDDFYSYNGVTSFTVEQSRKSPADHAIISLLNVAGTLDGTKRDAVVDLDYYGSMSQTSGASNRGGDSVATNTALDQPFGALILRPGLNVQLRVGYSNDPDMLEVLINGRVVDVTWNQGGDRAEILVQSFGTELIQAIKGSSFSNTEEGYPTTHQLLGAMMLQPELQHFGRWEFGQLYQIGEGADSRLDFYDYSRESFLGRFKHSNAMTKWLLDHPAITMTLAIGGAALLRFVPGLGRWLRPTGNLLTKFPIIGKWLTKIGSKAFSLAPGRGFYTKSLVSQLGARTGGAVTVASKATSVELAAIQKLTVGQRSATQVLINKIASKSFQKEVDNIRAKSILQFLKADNISSQSKILARADFDIQNLLLKKQWMAHPLRMVDNQTVGLIEAVGWKPISRVFGGIATRAPKLVVGAAIAGLGLDAMSWALDDVYEETIGRLRAYFRSKKVSMLLSPQDDNLFPPHPKDYMHIGDGSWTEFWSSVAAQSIRVTTSALFFDDSSGYEYARWFQGEDPFDKRVPPDQCLFHPMATTIWDVFHEMSLRHPGWVYGARPYGKEFRYTMFFGVPSQRYWARGADSEFVSRANDLARLLDGSNDKPEITVDEYRRLYGDEVLSYGGLLSLDDVSEELLSGALRETAAQGFAITKGVADDFFFREVASNSSRLVVLPTIDSSTFVGPEPLVKYFSDKNGGLLSQEVIGLQPWQPSDNPIEDGDIYKALINQIFTTRALKEYLLALSLRFMPFRRYHSISSDHDIVWNGLMSSENAVYNAVDVTYFNTDAEAGDSPIASSLFKAHAFIPENMLRVLSLPPSYNCRGYQMAMRYGQGSLLHTMRDMYRGEIIVLGNPRIRPWDVCILQDSYNEMVGPIEVEHVVHQFSHETGFITEIKPSALVIANEISSWPVLEAMKIMTLAVKNIDDQFLGLRAEEGGLPFRIIDWITGFGAGGSKEYVEYLKNQAEEIAPYSAFNSDDGDDFEAVQKLGQELEDTGLKIAAGLTAGAGLITFAAVYKTAPFLLSYIPKLGGAGTGKFFAARISAATVAGATMLTPYAGASLALSMVGRVTPSLAWLLGGPVLFLSCLRGDSIMLIPLMKNGHPIVSGLNLSDPSMIWNSFKGELGRWVDDTIGGTRDLVELWRIYGEHAWRRNASIDSATSDLPLYDKNRQIYAELTGEL